MLKYVYALAGLLSLAAGLSAQPAPRPLPPELAERLRALYGFSASEYEALRQTGEITRLQDNGFSSLLLPDKQLAGELLSDYKKLDPAFLVEALYVIPVSKGLAEGEDFRLKVYNTLHKIDTMKGLQYWSASGEKYQTMFNDAYVIANPDSEKPLPNPQAASIPPYDKIYVYQDDARFGENTYETVYRYYNGGRFRVTMKNLTRLFYGFFPVVQRENLLLNMVILPGEDYLVFYSCIGADVFSLFGMQDRLLTSFSNRLKALFSWFDSSLDWQG
ncbi:MAG: hypothetical protein LBQ57_13845 [Spirochaetales bacterium]|jgi:hypothetical protein|nr:hypothetical protein [Spirochaetales bacterium]